MALPLLAYVVAAVMARPHWGRVDAAAGAVLGNVVAAAVIIATATSVGHAAPLASVAQAAYALRPAVGASAPMLFAAGLLGASLLAAVVVPLSTAYAVAEAAGHERSPGRRLREAPLFTTVFVVQVVVGAAIALLPVDLVTLLVGVQIVNGVLAPVFLVFLVVLSGRRPVVGGAANGPGLRALATGCVVVVGGPALALAVLSVVGR